MIQRVQTLYYAITMILLAILLSGVEFFRFVGEKTFYVFSVYGVQSGKVGAADGKMESLTTMPFFLSVISFILFIFITLMAYKNLNRQFKLARGIFFIYLLLLIAVIIYAVIGGGTLTNEPTKRELGIGFLLFVLGFPFSFLAQLGIKRDKKLLDSLNRLR
jgi:hypothetical protein